MSSLSRNTELVQPECTAKPGRPSRWRSFAHATIRDDFLLECQLLLLSFSIGIQDAASFPDCSSPVRSQLFAHLHPALPRATRLTSPRSLLRFQSNREHCPPRSRRSQTHNPLLPLQHRHLPLHVRPRRFPPRPTRKLFRSSETVVVDRHLDPSNSARVRRIRNSIRRSKPRSRQRNSGINSDFSVGV